MRERTAVILIDPLNDFIHPDGKTYPALNESLTATDSVTHIHELLKGARSCGIPIYYCLHQLYRETNYDGWLHMRSVHHSLKQRQIFSGWGGEIMKGFEPDTSNGDVVVSRHWNSNAFANTDLDYQLRQREITHVIMAGMIANSCLEATAREATERGYKVTVLKDTTAGFSNKLKEAGETVWPTLFEEVITVKEWLASQQQEAPAWM